MRHLLTLLVAVICLHAQAQMYSPGRVIKCISGDCVNGSGEAIMSDVANYSGDVYYKGDFKNGLMNGEGIKVKDKYSVGHFKDGNKHGYMTEFNYDKINGIYVPDSTREVAFVDYSSEYGFYSMIVMPDGSVKNYSRYDGHFRKNWENDQKVKDKWINKQVVAFKLAREGKFAAPPPPPPSKPATEWLTLAVKKANTARDQWIQALQWDCLTDRTYYLTATPQTKYHQMPFAGHFTMQVVAPDNTVAFEGELGSYWTPRTPGLYTFLIKFYQDKILGSGASADYVSGVRIEWEFHSKKDL